jgi:fucose permease
MALLIVIYIVFISLGLPDSLFGVSWPVVHLEFGIQESFASAYGIIIGVCTGGVSFVAGKLIRKFGTGKVTFFSTLLTAVGLVGISFSPNIVCMIICSVILGYGAGAIDTGLNNYVSLHYKAKHMNWLHCFWGVGVTLSPMIMSMFLGGEAGEWRTGYRVIALIQLTIAMVVLATLRNWYVEAEQPTQQEERSEMKMLDLLRMKGVSTSILSLGLYCSGEFLLGLWGATYAVNVFGLGPEVAAKWISLYYGGIMLGRIISGFLSEKAEDDQLIKLGVMVSVIGVAILALPLGQISLVGLLLIGTGFGPIFPSVIHSVPRRFGSQYSADITGYHMGGAYAIGHAVQLTFGFVASRIGFAITPVVMLLLCCGVFLANRVTLKKLDM